MLTQKHHWSWGTVGALVILGLAGCNESRTSTEPAADRSSSTPPAATAPRESAPGEASTTAAPAPAPARPAPDEPKPEPKVVVDVLPTETAPPTEMPTVILSEQYAETCRVKVGDALPAGTLKDVAAADKSLADLYGKQLTVVVFWHAGGIYDEAELADLTNLVVKPFQSQGVEVVAVNVGDPAEVVKSAAEEAGVEFPLLLDSDSSYFAGVATERLPRTYLVDSSGKILWFDIGYGRTTRRQLVDAIRYTLAN